MQDERIMVQSDGGLNVGLRARNAHTYIIDIVIPEYYLISDKSFDDLLKHASYYPQSFNVAKEKYREYMGSLKK